MKNRDIGWTRMCNEEDWLSEETVSMKQQDWESVNGETECGRGTRESWGNARNQRPKINKVRGGSEEGSETSSEES